MSIPEVKSWKRNVLLLLPKIVIRGGVVKGASIDRYLFNSKKYQTFEYLNYHDSGHIESFKFRNENPYRTDEEEENERLKYEAILFAQLKREREYQEKLKSEKTAGPAYIMPYSVPKGLTSYYGESHVYYNADKVQRANEKYPADIGYYPNKRYVKYQFFKLKDKKGPATPPVVELIC